MGLDERLTDVTVIGAAGKMGSGIVLLLAQEMARLSLKRSNEGKIFRLNAVDIDPVGLRGLQDYVHTQGVKAAEKSTVALRELYADRADLVENADVIAEFVRKVDAMVWPTTDLNAARDSRIVFEAIVEKLPIKVKVLNQLNEICPNDTFYFTNTSSIPIGLLDDQVGLGGRIVGVHFYNPPAVQKLVEVIRSDSTRDDAVDCVMEIGKRLRKQLIPSADIAGFIGNGHFLRDGLHALREAEKLARSHGWVKAFYMINRISQDWLLRPMGIFQLLDYVGVDVFKFIQTVMNEYLEEDLSNATLDRLVEHGILGGQHSDGSQKPGILGYAKGVSSVIDVETGEHVQIDRNGWTKEADEWLGALPDGFRPWKGMFAVADRAAALQSHFDQVATMDNSGAEIARRYVQKSRQIGEALVNDGVAADAGDVNGVLLSGFYHLYGPINDYCK